MSSGTHGLTVDLSGALERGQTPGGSDDFGVPAGRELRDFALAIVNRRGISEARARLLATLGPDGVAAAAGVVGAFEAVNRVADATGTRLDDMMSRALDGPLADLGLQTMKREHD